MFLATIWNSPEGQQKDRMVIFLFVSLVVKKFSENSWIIHGDVFFLSLKWSNGKDFVGRILLIR